MAELAIPLVALGGMYVISNYKKENDSIKEGYSGYTNTVESNKLQVKPKQINYDS
jgi:hypothetical protein